MAMAPEESIFGRDKRYLSETRQIASIKFTGANPDTQWRIKGLKGRILNWKAPYKYGLNDFTSDFNLLNITFFPRLNDKP